MIRARCGSGLILPAAALLAWGLVPAWAGGQQVRVTGVSTLRHVEARPLRADSVHVDETRGSGLLRRGPDGQVVRCVVGATWCGYLASGAAVSTSPANQDLIVSAWGLARGLRAQAHVRARTVLAGEEHLWPRSDEAFEALTAYVELDRRRLRLRAGRHWVVDGLGTTSVDGATVEVRPGAGLSVALFGGRGLLRGLSEPRTGGALAALEPFAPDAEDVLLGARARWNGAAGVAVSASYRREIRRDRHALHAERAALDASWRGTWTEASAEVEADLATRVVNEARVEVAAHGGFRSRGAAAFYRWHRPYFEAWTIWGAFEPVGYSEVGARGWWRPRERPFSADVRVGWRTYEDTRASTSFGSYRGTGWHVTASGGWTPAQEWRVRSRIGVDVGFGAARDDFLLGVERRFGERTRLGASLQAFQRSYEFRVEEGSVWGAGLDGGIRVTPRLRVDGSAALYRHRADRDLPSPDWSQLRATVSARWTVGAEPGVADGGAR